MSDFKIRSVEEIASQLNAKEISFAQVVQVAMVLIGSGHMASALSDEKTRKVKEQATKLNNALVEKARLSTGITFLASPVTGGGVSVNRFQQLFILAINQGKKLPEDWAQSAWTLLASQNQRLLKDGKTIETAEGNLAELTQQAQEFASKRLSIFKSLQVL